MASNALKALLGVLAVAGYQNRDKISEILRGLRTPPQPGPDGQPQSGGLGDILGSLTGGGLGGLGGLFGGAGAGGILSGGLGDLLRRFEQKGHGETAKSWVDPGDNQPINNQDLSDVLGTDVLDELAARTGLSADEILARLSRDLPTAVDDMTPDGTLPADEDDHTWRAQPSVPSIKPQIV